MNDIFQGDPKIFITEQGANMVFKGGQPVMDQGLENAVIISLFTKPGWWGNDLVKETSKQIGSGYQDSSKTPITIQSINDVQNAADLALKWMRTKGIAKISISVNNPSSVLVDTNIKVETVGSDVQELRASTNGINWKFQAKNPAHGRV